MPKRIFWSDDDRFEAKPNKSPWLEMTEVLIDLGYDVSLLTGYGKTKYFPEHHRVKMLHFFAPDVPCLFRITLLLNELRWLLRNAKADDIIIVPPDGLLIAPFLRLFGRTNIHLDVRTVPVELNSLKRRVDRWLYWKFEMKFLHRQAMGHSFITERLKLAVEKEFNTTFEDVVVWQSGVNTKKFS